MYRLTTDEEYLSREFGIEMPILRLLARHLYLGKPYGTARLSRVEHVIQWNLKGSHRKIVVTLLWAREMVHVQSVRTHNFLGWDLDIFQQ